jgi:hypothetical protein
MLVLATALVPLSILARQNPATNGGETLVVLPFAAAGFVVARRQPGNPVGWLLLTFAACFLLSNDSGFYAAAVYHLGHHLPLGPAALVLYELWGPALGALLLVILLFPDGWPPPGFWRRAAWVWSAAVVLFMTALATAASARSSGTVSGSTASMGRRHRPPDGMVRGNAGHLRGCRRMPPGVCPGPSGAELATLGR